MFKNNTLSLAIISVLSVFALTGCGGGGGSNNTPSPVTPPTSSTPTWTAGVFEPSDELKNFCETPRTGNDPFNNNQPYPDQAGSALYEKLWLRSWSDETYLWYDEITDNNPESFDTVADYFAQLKTEELTDSGAKKDNFHFSEPSEDYFQEAQSGVTSGYGINWAFIGDSADRILRVAYLEDNSPASQIGFQRGDTVLEVDGVSINTNTQAGIDTLNEGLFSPTNGDSHTIIVRSNDGTEKTFNVTAGNIEQTPVQNVQTIVTSNNTRVGYMQFNSHIGIAQEGLIDAVNKFRTDNVDELVIDFRYNGGGLLALSSQLAYMVAGSANVQNRFYYQTQQNDKQPVDSPFPFIDEEIDYSTFFSTGDKLPDLNLSKVYVLSTSGTCSASEAFVNGLKGIDAEVILIGDTTCGKPYGFTPTHNCGTTYYTIQFSGVNSKGFGEYAAGFTPTPTPQFNADVQGCVVNDDFDNQLGDSNEALLSTALFHIDNNGACPITTTVANSKIDVPSFATASEKLQPLNAPNELTRGNMDLTWPTLSKEQ
ncbi:peptidase [Pseudoalteromonas sp. CR1]|uniref:S41 family peptidase n=1 Tax=Pseudoalteromonas sp. CR1 TaxID=2861964 RepID=UPI001C5DE755|nr:S41 family peptidase [Pseudoalteromonas sp. CR1]MBW4967370.1 peptidase [Pseudoalteromonas sp. CR1]